MSYQKKQSKRLKHTFTCKYHCCDTRVIVPFKVAIKGFNVRFKCGLTGFAQYNPYPPSRGDKTNNYDSDIE